MPPDIRDETNFDGHVDGAIKAGPMLGIVFFVLFVLFFLGFVALIWAANNHPGLFDFLVPEQLTPIIGDQT